MSCSSDEDDGIVYCTNLRFWHDDWVGRSKLKHRNAASLIHIFNRGLSRGYIGII